MNFGMLVFYLFNKRKVNAEFGNSRFCIIFLARKSSKADTHIQIYYCAKYRGMLVFYLFNKRKVNAEFGNSRFCIIFLARKSSKADTHIQIYYCAKYRP